MYQFVFEDGAWRFDGPVGILRAWGEIVRTDAAPGWREGRTVPAARYRNHGVYRQCDHGRFEWSA